VIACLESLSLVNISHIVRSIASLVLEASESDKDGEFSEKTKLLPFQHSYAMEDAHWDVLIAVIDSPCA
jgi:hypothetical protein